FRRHVPRGQARAAGGEHHVHLTRVRPAGELAGDAIGLVGHDAAYHDLVSVVSGPGDDRVPGRVGSLAERPEVADGQNPDPHDLHRPPPPISWSFSPRTAAPPLAPPPACRARRWRTLRPAWPGQAADTSSRWRS